MRLDREIRIGSADGEDVLPLLLLRNGHDGGLALTVSVAPFRLVCLNGMLLPIDGAARTWKARHTRRIADRLGDARRTLEIAWQYYDALEQTGERLIRQPLTAPAFDRFLAQLVPLPTAELDPGGRRIRNAETVREAIRTLYLTTPDLDAIRGTAWGALQAVGDYHDHHARTRQTASRNDAEARFERATEPAGLKDRALALLTV
jgi:phage/plasmid-like protein (TIGR03299 family)